jgi:hypothetical protein
MPIEFLYGRPLNPEELDMIRQQIESGFDQIAVIDPGIRGIVARNWPHLLAKLPPEDTTRIIDGGQLTRSTWLFEQPRWPRGTPPAPYQLHRAR